MCCDDNYEFMTPSRWDVTYGVTFVWMDLFMVICAINRTQLSDYHFWGILYEVMKCCVLEMHKCNGYESVVIFCFDQLKEL